MNKDALLATIIGVIIGVFLTAVIVTGPALFNRLKDIKFTLPKLPVFTQTKNTDPQNEEKIISDKPSEKSEYNFKIASPLNKSISKSEEILISGNAPSGSKILISGPLEEVVVTSLENNSFAGSIKIEEGVNTISALLLNKENPIIDTILIFYTQEEI